MSLILTFCQSADDATIAAIIAHLQRFHAGRSARSGNTVSFADVIQLHKTAISLKLDRGVLLAGVDPRIVADIPGGNSLSAQLLSDLHELNRVGAAGDGEPVLRIWLENAISLTGPRAERDIFEQCLRRTREEAVKDPAARP